MVGHLRLVKIAVVDSNEDRLVVVKDAFVLVHNDRIERRADGRLVHFLQAQ